MKRQRAFVDVVGHINLERSCNAAAKASCSVISAAGDDALVPGL